MADINGTPGADLLFGAADADLIAGGDGADILYGGAGNDQLLGGAGDDILIGEAGDDLLDGGADNDRLSSTDQGNDILMGGDGNDTISVFRNRAGDSLTLDGGAGNDRLVVQLTAAAAGLSVAGGSGDDQIDINALRSVLNLSLGAGRDIVNPIGLRTSVTGGGRIVISDFQAGPAGDRINFSSLTAADFTGWNLNGNLFGGGYLKALQSGTDVVISASFGGNGTYVDAIVLQNVLLSSLTADNLGGWTWDGSAIPAQTINGSGAAETLRGNGGDDEIFGLDGDDILEGHAGADIMWGGEGNDILRGGAGPDILHGGAGNDTLGGETGGDSLFGEDGDDRLTLSVATGAAVGFQNASGGAGQDIITILGSTTNASFTVDAGAGDDLVTVASLGNIAFVALGDGRDRLDLDNWVRTATNVATIDVADFATGDGGDRLEWGAFLMKSGAFFGDNPFVVGGFARLVQAGSDVLLQFDRDGGGDQYATFITFRNTDAAAFTAYNLGFAIDGADSVGATFTGTADADRLFGTDGDDVIDGQGGADVLLGHGGDDEIHGGEGDDSINGGAGDDAIDGGAGNDVIDPGGGEDVVDGGDGNDQFIDDSSFGYGNKGFIGGAGDDSVFFLRLANSPDSLVASGGEGNDYFSVQNTASASAPFFLDGGVGDDIFDVAGNGQLTLGAGVDMVRFTSASPFANFGSTIYIQDFTVGDLGDRLGFATLVQGFTNFTNSANPFTSGYLKLVQNGSSTMVYADVDGPSGPGQDRLVAILSGVDKHSLTSHNIGGYGLPFTLGTSASETFQGTALGDDFVGGGGNDTFLVGYGGNDFATGGTGNDLFYVATSNNFGIGNVTITGGGGNDILQLQAKASQGPLALQAAQFGGGAQGIPIVATGIGTVQLLSGYDSSRGWALNSAVSYFIQIADGFAPTAAPLIIDTTHLAADERLNIESDYIKDADAVLKLVGGVGVDHVYAGAGGSYLDGGGGDDELFGGRGDDTLLGGAGADILRVDSGSNPSGIDILDGGEGNDRVQIVSVAGAVTVALGAGSDSLEFPGSPGGTLMAPGTSITVTDFDPGPGGDTLVWANLLHLFLSGYNGENPFGSGHARLLQDGADVLLQLSFHADGNFLTLVRLQNHQAIDFARGLGGFLPFEMQGTSGDDFLVGTGSDDALNGQAGNDIIDGGAGADTMAGGAGNDVFYVDNAGDVVVENAGQGTDEVRTSLAVYSLVGLPDVENLTAADNVNHDFRGNSGNNVVTGGGGNDTIRVYDGGNDTVHGGAGADLIFIGAALTSADLIDGGADIDTLILQGNGVLTLTSNVTNIENLSILAGTNTNVGAPGTELYDYVITTNDANFAAGLQVRVNAGALLPGEDFTFDGRAETDASFVVYGGRGVDTLLGGLGNDIFFFAEKLQFAPGDTVDGGVGYDSVYFRGNYTIDFNAPGYAGQFNSIESMTLTSASDTRYARGGPSEFDYSITLADANLAAGVTLTINGTLLQSFETMVVDGSQETDGFLRIFAGSSDDTIKGGGQADLIHGNFGADTLTGGGGADTFRYQKSGESTAASMDHILDFTPGTDKIELTRMDANTIAAGNQDFHWIGSNAFTGAGASSAGELHVFEQSGTWFVEGDTNGDGSGDFLIALTLQGQTPLSQNDFFL